MDTDPFNSAHRRSIGVTVALMEGLVQELRQAGLPEHLLDCVEEELAELEAGSGANRPGPRPSELQAKLAQMLVYAMELDSRQLRSRGSLSPEASAFLDERSQRLCALIKDLMDSVIVGGS